MKTKQTKAKPATVGERHPLAIPRFSVQVRSVLYGWVTFAVAHDYEGARREFDKLITACEESDSPHADLLAVSMRELVGNQIWRNVVEYENERYSIHHVCNDWSLELHRDNLTRAQVEAELQEMGGVKFVHRADSAIKTAESYTDVKDQHGDTFLRIQPAFV